MIVPVEAARQGVTVGEDTASGLMFADDFVGTRRIAETEKALENTRKWRVTANECKKVRSSCM